MKRSWDLTQGTVLGVNPAGLVVCQPGACKRNHPGPYAAGPGTVPARPGARYPASPGTAGSPSLRKFFCPQVLCQDQIKVLTTKAPRTSVPSHFLAPLSCSFFLHDPGPCLSSLKLLPEDPEAWLSSSSSAFHPAKATKARRCKEFGYVLGIGRGTKSSENKPIH